VAARGYHPAHEGRLIWDISRHSADRVRHYYAGDALVGRSNTSVAPLCELGQRTARALAGERIGDAVGRIDPLADCRGSSGHKGKALGSDGHAQIFRSVKGSPVSYTACRNGTHLQLGQW
jgi:hypothetical protein